MPLDLEALKLETLDPSPSRGEVKTRRLQTVNRMVELGTTYRLIARTCGVTSRTARTWQQKGTAPTVYTAQVALDRLAPMLEHMESDLGLTDETIGKFLSEETFGFEDEISPCAPHYWYYSAPLTANLGISSHGPRVLERFEQRLQIRFPEQTGIDSKGKGS